MSQSSRGSESEIWQYIEELNIKSEIDFLTNQIIDIDFHLISVKPDLDNVACIESRIARFIVNSIS